MLTLALASFLVSALVASGTTAYFRFIAVSRRMLDVPGERSSHQLPTPTAGGVGIAAGILAGYLVVRLFEGVVFEWAPLLALGMVCALLGHADDRRGVKVWIRLLIEFALAAALMLSIAVPSPPGLLHVPLLIFCTGLVAVTNFFNFMDGIDGLAASQGCFMALAFGILGELAAHDTGQALPLLAVCGACAGFLLWNWAPARIFMGDTGSLMLGFLLGGTVLISAMRGEFGLQAGVIPWAIFVVDTVLTLIARAFRGETLYQSHRQHLYQILARSWNSHAKVVIAYQGINVCWVLPLAIMAVKWPQFSTWIAMGAYIPLVIAYVVAVRHFGSRSPGADR